MSVGTLSTGAAALEALESMALPTKRDEPWRYAPHKKLSQITFGPAYATALPDDVESQIPDIDGPCLVIVNGSVDKQRSKLDSLPAGFVLLSLADAPEENVAGLLERSYDSVQDAFSLINRAYSSDGALLLVEGQSEQPIHIVDICVPGSEHNATASRVIIDVAAGGSATVVETRIGSGQAFGGSSVHTEISLASGSKLEHIILQDLPASQIHLGRVEVTQASASTLQARLFNLGGDYGRVVYHVHLDGQEAHAELSGLYFGFGDQTLDQQINVVHAAANCTSRQSYRGVLDDASTGIWNGGVDVRPGADGTDSEQSNDNLLMSRQAEINTMPRLEILADEVSCQHGATVGELDDEALYYMRSRGIGEDEARRLLIDGFANQVMDDLESETIRAWITERLRHVDE